MVKKIILSFLTLAAVFAGVALISAPTAQAWTGYSYTSGSTYGRAVYGWNYGWGYGHNYARPNWNSHNQNAFQYYGSTGQPSMGCSSYSWGGRSCY